MAVVKTAAADAVAKVAPVSKSQAKRLDVQKADAPKAVGVVKIVGQPEKAYRPGCARDKWWGRFNQFNGKPLAELEASCMADPPSLPKKAKDPTEAEKFSGWLAFFKDVRKHVTIA